MDDQQLQYIAAILGDLFDTMRRIAAAADRIAAADEARLEIERKRIVAGQFGPQP